MAQILFANNAATTLATAIASSTTTLVVTSGGGALFPNPGTNQYFLATLSPATPGAQPQEIVRVTARSTDTLTVLRSQEGTSALSWGTGTIVQNLLTAATVGTFPQTVPFAGNPNGNIAGAAASGNLPPSMVWDYSNNLMYVCLTSGTASTAQWSAQAPLPYVDAGLALKTAFSNFIADNSADGYIKIPANSSGSPSFIIQWGTFSGTTGGLSANGVAEINPINVTWKTPFTSAPLSVVCSPRDVSGSNLQEIAWTGNSNNATSGSFGLSCRQASTAMTGSYVAMGF
jgi:hypothetical protein